MEKIPKHTCHAIGGTVATPPRLFACLPHWSMLPAPLRRAILATCQQGQERDWFRFGSWREALAAAGVDQPRAHTAAEARLIAGLEAVVGRRQTDEAA